MTRWTTIGRAEDDALAGMFTEASENLAWLSKKRPKCSSRKEEGCDGRAGQPDDSKQVRGASQNRAPPFWKLRVHSLSGHLAQTSSLAKITRASASNVQVRRCPDVKRRSRRMLGFRGARAMLLRSCDPEPAALLMVSPASASRICCAAGCDDEGASPARTSVAICAIREVGELTGRKGGNQWSVTMVSRGGGGGAGRLVGAVLFSSGPHNAQSRTSSCSRVG